MKVVAKAQILSHVQTESCALYTSLMEIRDATSKGIESVDKREQFTISPLREKELT